MRITPRPEWLESDNKALRAKVEYLESERERLHSKIDTMKGVLYLTFILSALAIILIIEDMLYPWLRTL